MTSFLYCVLLFQVESIGLGSLFPSTATNLTNDQINKNVLPGLPSTSSSSEPAGIFGPVAGGMPAAEDETKSYFGLECPERNMFRLPSDPDRNKCPTIDESEGVWTWETPHPYSNLTCCLETFKCPNPSHQIHIQIKSYFGIRVSSNPNRCEVRVFNRIS